MRSKRLTLLQNHQAALRSCARCSDMHQPAVVGEAVLSEVLLVGQAPGDREPRLGRPFAWTAGRQLFKWFAPLGLDEAQFRSSVYMAAVCRCFPGKHPKGGDRVPTTAEIAQCRPWLDREIELLAPTLIVPVGRLAIEQFLPARPLVQQIGVAHRIALARRRIDLIALPHPSGASTWPRSEPGKTLTQRALQLIAAHPAFRRLLTATPRRTLE
jgi:uracil-DNA glycosylase